jgi:Tfp pilus assembly protein PilX
MNKRWDRSERIARLALSINRQGARALRRGRKGVALVIALMCVVISSAIAVSLVRQCVMQRQLARQAQHTAQAQWLLEAGSQRAAARVAGDAAYAGESWSLPAAELAAESAGGEAGVVAIEVTAVAGQPNARRVRVVADFPAELPHRTRKVREFVLERN